MICYIKKKFFTCHKMPASQGDTLKEISKVARKEFSRRGYQMFEKPVKQLFDFDDRGNLVVNPNAQHNTAILADMLLRTQICGTVVSLKQSLKLTRGESLYYNSGCKIIIVVKFEGSTSRLVAFAVIMNLNNT